MSKKYEDYDYDGNDETSSNSTLAKKVLIILLIVIAIFIIIYLLNGKNYPESQIEQSGFHLWHLSDVVC